MVKASKTFVIAWSQTEIDGVAGLPVEALSAGIGWSWTGEAVCIDGSNDILVLTGAEGSDDLRQRASRAAHRVLRRASVDLARQSPCDDGDARIERDFTVTDGTRRFRVALIDTARAARPLLMFTDAVPPRDRELWVVTPPRNRRARLVARSDSVICFVRGTRLRTPGGYVAVEDLMPGDRLSTRDDGPQQVQWIGRRHLSGARLAADPQLRPVRIRSGGLGGRDPRGDLLVSPRHRLLLRGKLADALFRTPEVLVEAKDLLNDRSITVDHGARSVDYFHVLLPRHQVVWANGVASESFHPAHAGLDELDAQQAEALERVVPGLTQRPGLYGDSARRRLSGAEAAILLSEQRLAG